MSEYNILNGEDASIPQRITGYYIDKQELVERIHAKLGVEQDPELNDQIPKLQTGRDVVSYADKVLRMRDKKQQEAKKGEKQRQENSRRAKEAWAKRKAKEQEAEKKRQEQSGRMKKWWAKKKAKEREEREKQEEKKRQGEERKRQELRQGKRKRQGESNTRKTKSDHGQVPSQRQVSSRGKDDSDAISSRRRNRNVVSLDEVSMDVFCKCTKKSGRLDLEGKYEEAKRLRHLALRAYNRAQRKKGHQ
ncbi:MAG: hypothetical protein AB1473_13150 [Thermodesulfobacteriota bacterium]